MFGVIKLKPKLIQIFEVFLIIMLSAGIICFPSISSFAAEGIKQGMEYSVNLLVPSLFPFMVISSFTMRSGAAEIIGKFFAPVTKYIFRLPPVCSSAIILGLTGGFPVGAKCTAVLYNNKKINAAQAERMMYFCVCSGAAFLVTAIGTIMLKNAVCGVILYFSQIVSCLMIGVISGFFDKKNAKNIDKTENTKNTENSENFISAFINSCSDGAVSIINMTALVMIFSMFINILKVTGIFDIFPDTIIFSVLEVTSACKVIFEKGFPLWTFSAAAGFGGLCVHLQIFNILKDVPINRKKFMFFRFVNSVLSGVITFMICRIYNPSVNVSNVFMVSTNQQVKISSGTAAGTAAIIIMSAVFVLTLKSNNRNKINK